MYDIEMDTIIEQLKNVFLIPANEYKGFGYSQFIRHPKGNLLIPRLKATSLSQHFGWIAEQGGIDYVLISDRHFAGPGCVEVADEFEASLTISDIEAKAVRNKVEFDSSIQYALTEIAPHLTAIPTPGHTPGQFCYAIKFSSVRCIFTGDFFRWRHNECIPGNASRKKMIEGTNRLSEFGFSKLVGCVDYDITEGTYINSKDAQLTIETMLDTCVKP